MKKILSVLMCGLSLVAHAELQWDQKAISLRVHPLQVEAQTAFHLTNVGTEPVGILSVQTSCGCLKASGNTNQIVPGESSTITATFDFRDKIGPQRKSIAVSSSDNPKQPIFLYVEANIPEVYTLDTKRLEWPLSGNCESKTCRLVNHLNNPIRLISVSSSSKQFIVELKPIREGFEYEVQVCPIESFVPGLAVITVRTECPLELAESRTYTFTATLR
jgi:hypothetical protein